MGLHCRNEFLFLTRLLTSTLSEGNSCIFYFEQFTRENLAVRKFMSPFLMTNLTSEFFETSYKTVRLKITWSGTQLFTESLTFSNVLKSATNLLNASLSATTGSLKNVF